MQSVILVVENLTSDNTQYGWILNEIEKALSQHKDVVFLSKNVLHIPGHSALLAISVVDAQCRVYSAQSGQSFQYKCLFFEEETEWIYSTGRLQNKEPR